MADGVRQRKSIGYFFLILSTVLYAAALLLPLINNIHVGIYAILFTVFVVVAEISFLFGAFFLGKEIVKKYRSKLNPFKWFKKKDLPDTAHDYSNGKEGK